MYIPHIQSMQSFHDDPKSVDMKVDAMHNQLEDTTDEPIQPNHMYKHVFKECVPIGD